MSALDSLLGLLELRRADGLVLVPGEPPSLLGGRDRSLTMPPLDEATVNGFFAELLAPEVRAALAPDQPVEAEHRSARSGTFVVKARLESGRLRLVIRRGALRSPSRPAEARPEPARTEPPAIPAAPGSASEALLLLAPLLETAVQRRASDLLVASGREPVLKLRGEVVPLAGPVVDEAELAAAFETVLGPERRERLARTGSADLALEYPRPHGDRPVRFRVNLFRHQGGLTAVLRPIWDTVPTLEELRLPRTLRRVVEPAHGLVLFAGPTGSGKSTSLAALLQEVNQARACHVLTLEDPIEYVFPPARAVVHQRELGAHLGSFADGLRAALRESPDVILLGELRDAETISLALTAAETGHLVLSTIHAGSAPGAVERVIHAAPEADRAAVRSQLASVLRYVVVQQLVASTDGGLVPAVGVLAVNHAVASLIREGKPQQLATQMEIGAEEGMVTLEAALAELVRAGRITREAALGATTQQEALEQLLPKVQ